MTTNNANETKHTPGSFDRWDYVTEGDAAKIRDLLAALEQIATPLGPDETGDFTELRTISVSPAPRFSG